MVSALSPTSQKQTPQHCQYFCTIPIGKSMTFRFIGNNSVTFWFIGNNSVTFPFMGNSSVTFLFLFTLSPHCSRCCCWGPWGCRWSPPRKEPRRESSWFARSLVASLTPPLPPDYQHQHQHFLDVVQKHIFLTAFYFFFSLNKELHQCRWLICFSKCSFNIERGGITSEVRFDSFFLLIDNWEHFHPHFSICV